MNERFIECCFPKAEDTLKPIDLDELHKKAQQQSQKQKSTRIDPHWQLFTDNPDYTVCFESEFNHGQFKMAKIYYIITKEMEVHRLTVERLFVHSQQTIHLNSKLILTNNDQINEIVWNDCVTEIVSNDGRVHWSRIGINIGQRSYTLINEEIIGGLLQHKYGKLRTDKEYNLKKYYISYCVAILKMQCEVFWSLKKPKTPQFTLKTYVWNGECTELDRNEYFLTIDTKTVIDEKYRFLNGLLLFLDILFCIPTCVIISVVVIFGLPTLIYKLCKGETIIEEEIEPITVVFDENEAIQYLIQYMTDICLLLFIISLILKFLSKHSLNNDIIYLN
eukprot:195395_1